MRNMFCCLPENFNYLIIFILFIINPTNRKSRILTLIFYRKNILQNLSHTTGFNFIKFFSNFQISSLYMIMNIIKIIMTFCKIMEIRPNQKTYKIQFLPDNFITFFILDKHHTRHQEKLLMMMFSHTFRRCAPRINIAFYNNQTSNKLLKKNSN